TLAKYEAGDSSGGKKASRAAIAEALLAPQFWRRLEGHEPSDPLPGVRRAVEIYAALKTGYPSNPHYRSGFARSAFELGAALPLAEGKAHMLAALDCQKQLAEEQPEVSRHLMAWSWMAMAIHRAMHRGGEHDPAIALLEEHVGAIMTLEGRPESASSLRFARVVR
ncbi:MAG: hypothetical protein GY720_22010, partial [bacterium]|nr:hypothetical protein [bacterium]